MPICKNCGNIFPYNIIIEGKKRNLGNRKFCLTCSPFGSGNTRSNLTKIIVVRDRKDEIRFCLKCGKEFKSSRRWICSGCATRKRRDKNRERIHQIAGLNCQLCNYGGSEMHMKLLTFHHVDPSIKKFEMSVGNLTGGWEIILEELKKCILVCFNCHNEIHHTNLITDEKIRQMHLEMVDRIECTT